jgi:hypothetical protein
MITSQVHLAAKTKDFIIQKNNKNGIKLSHESFSYVKDRGSNFRFVRYNKTKKHPACPGRVHLLNNLEGPVLKRVDHNHKPDPTADSITTFIDEVKLKAKHSKDKPRSIIGKQKRICREQAG